MRITLIVAMDGNGLIGRGGTLPWRLPADLKHFKTVTMGKPVLMGRKTHASIGKALPGRRNIVLTRDTGFEADGCRVVHGIAEALQAAEPAEELMVIGGAEIYRALLPRADRLLLTRVEGSFAGDTYFPELAWDEWRETAVETHEVDERNPHRYTFVTLERRC